MDEAPTLIPLGCACKGSLLLVHAHCADRWYTQQGRTVCELCRSPMHMLVTHPMAPALAAPPATSVTWRLCLATGLFGVTVVATAAALSVVATFRT